MGLEQFKPLFFLINVTGLLPHSIVLDETKLRFNRFKSGWHYPTTWWFLLITTGHLIWTLLLNWEMISSLLRSDESLNLILVLIIWQVSYSIGKLIPLFLVFNTGRLKSVFSSLGKFDHTFKSVSEHVPKPCTTKKRTVIGLTIGILIVTAK